MLGHLTKTVFLSAIHSHMLSNCKPPLHRPQVHDCILHYKNFSKLFELNRSVQTCIVGGRRFPPQPSTQMYTCYGYVSLITTVPSMWKVGCSLLSQGHKHTHCLTLPYLTLCVAYCITKTLCNIITFLYHSFADVTKVHQTLPWGRGWLLRLMGSVQKDNQLGD